MTHQNHQTNGASLEDCHTNFFALTELYGIKWRKLVWGETSGGGDGEEGAAPLADPVISSYARCLAGDILCVWRRVPAPQPPPDNIYETVPPAPPPPLSLRAAKELWIFWYGEEPDLNGLVAPELIASRDPWHLSFSFAFFLHGESTVCASVDVRQHPPVRTLTAKRLAKLSASDSHADAKVILAPFGLEGTLTGRDWSESDAATARLLDAWRQLYPLEQGCGAVEVVCGGARMRYPVPYALETDMRAPPAPPPRANALATRALHALTTPKPHQTAEICYNTPSNEDFVDPTRKVPCSCAKGTCTSGAGSGRGGPRGASGGSPGSCGAASPPHPGSAPPSAGPPPPSPHNHHHQSGNAMPTTLHTPAPTPDPHAPPTPAPPSAPPPKQGESPSAGAGLPCLSTGGSGGAGDGAPPELARRPALPSPERRLDPLEDEHSLHMLYDYTTVLAWLDHPVKRFKSEENTFREELALGTALGADLYAGHDHTSMAAMPDHHALDIKQEKADHEDVKEYKNLFTSDGLCPTLKDLEQIFDNSDDAASGDETVRLLQVQTPPDSNKSAEESRCAGRCVRAEELSKMFPTPPSMEAHAVSSPGFTPLDDAPAPHHPGGSPPPDPIEDWSYVFKPPTVYKYVGSSKYAPLTTLPSQLLPPVSLPPNAVYRPRWQHATNSNSQAGAEREADTERTAGVKRSASPSSETRETNRGRRSEPGSTTPAASTAVAASPAPGSNAVAATPAAASPAASPRPAHAACPLLVNVLLADTVLNVFRDHNFDSCTLCVCNAGPKVVGNIRGADAATYLSGCAGVAGWDDDGASPSAADDEPSNCNCGFSAIVNRRLAHTAGLFYEDEMEITGLPPESVARLGAGTAGLADVAGVVAAACAGPAGGSASALARAAMRAAQPAPPDELRLNLLEYSDGSVAAAKALRAACGGSVVAAATVHRWPFIGARAPRSSRDVVRLMRRLRPLLQDAIQKRCCGARMWDGVTGPLTWRQFHRLAGRGNEDLCEPQPVPPLLVGHERDWVSLSPYALRHWERLALEPYAYARDVQYVVLCADADALADPLRAFFRELGAAYEACRLGRHRPLSRVARDGIYRAAPDRDRDRADDWLPDAPPGRLGLYLRAYADALRTTLLPLLASATLTPTPAQPQPKPDLPPTPTAHPEEESVSNPVAGCTAPEEDESGMPALVVYLVEPPASHAHRPAALHALLRLAARAHHHLAHHNPLIKIISLEGICEAWGMGSAGGEAGAAGAGGGAEARALAFSVFSGARRLLAHTPNGKSLTGFGTAADANLFLSNKDEKNRAPYKLFSPAWVLAPPRALKEVAETWGQSMGEQGAVLFLSYCLSHDQRWLLAAATDARGELLDTVAINIHVPPRSRLRRCGPARRLGLRKLMDFTLGVMSQAAQPWRLVVGRVGRIGHGELKGWSWLLSRKNLVRASNVLRELCGSCGVLYPSGVPCIVSACLVSTEPDSCLRLMADRFTPDERFSQASIQSHLHTPRDVSATHILVFPTSATTQSNPMPFEQPMANGVENDMMFLDVDMADEDMGEDNMAELLIGDMFNHMWPQGSPRASPRRADHDPASPHPPHHHHYHGQDDAAAEQVGTVLQQPLALGYMVSTAPLGGMPAWWWAGCTHLRDACPAFLKNALHLHAGSLQSEDTFTLSLRQNHNGHPLDSQTTTDVLRYVLEGYNALSWLALDVNTHDRRSCLPLHVQVLMQLYHTAAALG
ncbi:hypothetical protein ABMA28_014554 [Loxostege sticticalis]|uniref:Mediator of RNA polymerase II transcription subunit 13 n=1 Tax=Loxostege sticticalis TaxID=481309 RepID=A0ABD0THG8_LOXSC